MEVNEEDLADRGININPSELDILLPVINPTKLPPDLHVQAETLKPLEPLSSRDIRYIMSTDNTLSNIKHVLNKSSSSQTNKPKLLTRISSSPKKEQLKSKGQPKDLYSKASINSKTNNISQAKINLKQPLVRYTNTTKEHKLHPKQAYYNIYDVDKPVTINRVQKHEETLSKEKQEILNNTLAAYGLRLDPKGQNVILHDTEEHSGSMRNENGIGKKEIKGRKGIDKKIARKAKEKKHEKHFKRKNVDAIKSLWSILQNVSQKWK